MQYSGLVKLAIMKYELVISHVISHVPATIRHVNRESRGTACRWGLERECNIASRGGIKGDEGGSSGINFDHDGAV